VGGSRNAVLAISNDFDLKTMVIEYRVAQKSKPLSDYQKIALKPANEIRLFPQIKVSMKHT